MLGKLCKRYKCEPRKLDTAANAAEAFNYTLKELAQWYNLPEGAIAAVIRQRRRERGRSRWKRDHEE